MADLFVDHRPISIINRVVGTVALSPHIGLLPSKFTRRMRDYFLTQKPETIQHWQRKLWLGFSAERQQEFDARWTDMRELADAGWTVFVSIAPMLGPVTLPADFLALRDRAWAICSGEVCGPEARPMDAAWPRAIRDRCKPANVPFFMLQVVPEFTEPTLKRRR